MENVCRPPSTARAEQHWPDWKGPESGGFPNLVGLPGRNETANRCLGVKRSEVRILSARPIKAAGFRFIGVEATRPRTVDHLSGCQRCAVRVCGQSGTERP